MRCSRSWAGKPGDASFDGKLHAHGHLHSLESHAAKGLARLMTESQLRVIEFLGYSGGSKTTRMTIAFEVVGEERNVARHLLRFRTEEDYLAALEKVEEGFIRFHNGDNKNLLGRIVRVSATKYLIEVDAAEDTEPQL